MSIVELFRVFLSTAILPVLIIVAATLIGALILVAVVGFFLDLTKTAL